MIGTIPGMRSVIIVIAVIAMLMFAALHRESRSGETFAVGEVDIQIDNESYYNGKISTSTTWDLRDLTIERFFDFNDVKPSDYGEDTISIHVLLEDTYLCADVTLTSNNENGCNEPEGLVDTSCGNPGQDEGELADLVEFMWWADDGDNVLEDDETVISQGPIGALTLGGSTTLTLADSALNIWTEELGAVNEGSTHYIGKAWCFGTIAPDPLVQDGESDAWNPSLDNDALFGSGQPEDGGFTCDGSLLGNKSQGDSLTADVSFHAIQAFGNDGYLCSDGEPLENEGGDPESLFSDGFGNGSTDDTFNESPIWEEGGAGAEKSGPAGSEESSSPEGNRFARMRGPDGLICKSLDVTGFTDLLLSYYWRGDDQAIAGDIGLLEYATGGTCAAPTGLTPVMEHDMTDTTNPPWILETDIDLSGVNNSSFLLFFRASTSGTGVDFRIDGVELTGVPI